MTEFENQKQAHTVTENDENGFTRLIWTFSNKKQASDYRDQLEAEEDKMWGDKNHAHVWYSVVTTSAYI